MHRSTPLNSSFRSYVAGGSRATVDKVDDIHLWQEMAGNMMHSETRDAVEHSHPYGFSSVVADAEKDAMGKIISSAECFMSYGGGNRTGISVSGNIGDRRHRMRGLEKGDVGVARGKDDDMQIHLTQNGMFHSAPQKVRLQIVPQGSGKANPPQQKPKANTAEARSAKALAYAAHGPRIEERLWAGLEPELQEKIHLELDRAARADGGGGPGGGGQSGQQGQQNKPTGQKAVADAGANSDSYVDVTQEETNMGGKRSQLKTPGDRANVDCNKDQFVYVGRPKEKGPHAFVVTTKGPAKNTKAWA